MDEKRLGGFVSQTAELLRTLKTVNLSLSDLLTLIRDILDLLAFPDWTDPHETREWVNKLLAVLEGLARKTGMELDETVIEWSVDILEDDSVWNAMHTLLVGLFDEMGVDDDEVRKLAGDIELDPEFMLARIERIWAIIETWKNR